MTKNLLRCFFILPCLSHFCLKAQDTLSINEVTVRTSLVRQTLLRTTVAAAVIDSSQLRTQSSLSAVAAFNTIAGVRMEERSPGSYRLSIRGSLLRSPFGVRNVKMYLNEYPLTDAGGNTYINVLSMNTINHVDILKGPDGSLFGANSGGVVSINTGFSKDNLVAEVAGGSYGLAKQNIMFTKAVGKHIFNVAESYQRSDGYRENSKLHRLYLQATDDWRYKPGKVLKALVFYSDLYYQTPGGLTQAQYDQEPRKARPATMTLPGAAEQKAAVYNKMLFAGLTHEAQLTNRIEHVLAVFGSTVDFKNPFITNFETRQENTYGARTFFRFSTNPEKPATRLEYTIGGEWQQTRSSISNFGNSLGNKAALIADGKIASTQRFIFNRLKLDISKKLIVEAGLSLNYYSFRFRDSALLDNRFKAQWMPRAAVSYSPVKQVTLRTSVSRGYSPPTTAEIRPSDNNIYRDLQAETGTNVEVGGRYSGYKNRIWLDVSVYNYQLKNAIVRQQTGAGTEYFLNAGGTRQQGLEVQASYAVISPLMSGGFINKLQVNNATTFNNFKFSNYSNTTGDFSGNQITGVPKRSCITSLLAASRQGTYVFIQHNHTSAIPLNDANSVFAHAYDLVQAKLGHTLPVRKCLLEVYVGADNLFNERYSLGNDLNAAGNRFFNAAARRNYFAGIIISKRVAAAF